MKKEENENQVTYPVNIVFIPQKMQIEFGDKLKLQLAFYRNNKVCKTKPKKYLKPEITQYSLDGLPIIQFHKEELPFCTTINSNRKQRSFESKHINAQIACDATGSKEIFEANLDLKSILQYKASFQEKNILINFNQSTNHPLIKLYFDIKVRFEDFKEDQTDQSHQSPVDEQPEKQNKNRLLIPEISSDKKMVYNSINSPSSGTKKKAITFDGRDQNYEDNRSTENSPHFNEEERRKASRKKSKTKNELEKEADYEEEVKGLKKQIAQMKDSRVQETNKFNHQITRLKSSLQSLQLKNQSLERQKEYLQRSKNQGKTQLQNKADEIKTLKASIKQLNKLQDTKLNDKNTTMSQYLHQIQDLQGKIKASQFIQEQWKHKYQESQQKYLKLMQEKGQLSYQLSKSQKQLQKLKEQYKSDRAQFEQELQSIRDQYSRKKSNQQSSDELQKLRKEVSKKEEMIRKLEKNKGNQQSQLQKQLGILKKENNELKELIESLKKNDKTNSNISALDLKIASQKLKKQCDQARKMEKSLLVEKSQLQSRNKTMWEELIKLKETIANMLNLIQEEASQDLFTKVTDCII